jgi:hypothetical protein
MGQSKMSFEALAKGFTGEIFVPVWSSQMAVVDWVDFAEAPMICTTFLNSPAPEIKIENRSGHAIEKIWIFQGRNLLAESGKLAAGRIAAVALTNEPVSIQRFLGDKVSMLKDAASGHESVLGNQRAVNLDDWGGYAARVSLISLASDGGDGGGNHRAFVWPAGLDVGSLTERSDLLVLAWAPDSSLIPELNDFSVFRSRRGTLLRLFVPSSKIP